MIPLARERCVEKIPPNFFGAGKKILEHELLLRNRAVKRCEKRRMIDDRFTPGTGWSVENRGITSSLQLARDDGYGAHDIPGGFVFLNYVSKSLRLAWGLLRLRS